MLKMIAIGDELKAFIEEFGLLDAGLLQFALDPQPDLGPDLGSTWSGSSSRSTSLSGRL